MSDKKIITYEMTGSPKESGFKTKSELIEYLKGKGYVKDDLSREGAGAVPEHERHSNHRFLFQQQRQNAEGKEDGNHDQDLSGSPQGT